MDRELYLDLYGDERYPDPDGYCRICGSIVSVKHYRGTWDEWWGGSPPETIVKCPNCGVVDDYSETPVDVEEEEDGPATTV